MKSYIYAILLIIILLLFDIKFLRENEENVFDAYIFYILLFLGVTFSVLYNKIRINKKDKTSQNDPGPPK